MKKKIFYWILIINIMILFSCFEVTEQPAWEKEFEIELNKTFITPESGIIKFKIDGSLIYVTVNSTVPLNEYNPMARAWALQYSREKQKHGGSTVTAFIMNVGKKGVSITYSESKGFH